MQIKLVKFELKEIFYCIKRGDFMTIENKTDNKYLDILIKDAFNRMAYPYNNPHITVKDYDLDRVYLDVDGEEFNIRTWNILDIDTTKIEIEYTLFKVLSEGYYKIYKGKTLVIHK